MKRRAQLLCGSKQICQGMVSSAIVLIQRVLRFKGNGENLMSVLRCGQMSSRVLTSGQPKQKQNCRFQLRLRVQLLWYPCAHLSPFYPNLVSHCSSQQVCLIYFFPNCYRYPLQWLSGSEGWCKGNTQGSAGGKMGYAEVTISAEKNVC